MVDRIICLFACFILVHAYPAPSVIKDNIAEETNVAKSIYTVVEPNHSYEDTDSIVEDPTWTPSSDYETSDYEFSSYENESESESYGDSSTASSEENSDEYISDEDSINKSTSSNESEITDNNGDADSAQTEEYDNESIEKPSQETEEINNISGQSAENDETVSDESIEIYESRKKRFTKIYKRSTDESLLSVISKDGPVQSESGSNQKTITRVENAEKNSNDRTTEKHITNEPTRSRADKNDGTTKSNDVNDFTHNEEDSDNETAKTDENSNNESAKTNSSVKDKNPKTGDDSKGVPPQRYHVYKYSIAFNNFRISCKKLIDSSTGEVIEQDCPY